MNFIIARAIEEFINFQKLKIIFIHLAYDQKTVFIVGSFL